MGGLQWNVLAMLGHDIEALAARLLDELLRAGAVRLESGGVVPMMAA
jgi:hypothetical protein